MVRDISAEESLFPLRLPQRRPLATVAPLYGSDDDEYAPQYEPEFVSEYYEPEDEEEWRRESPSTGLRLK